MRLFASTDRYPLVGMVLGEIRSRHMIGSDFLCRHKGGHRERNKQENHCHPTLKSSLHFLSPFQLALNMRRFQPRILVTAWTDRDRSSATASCFFAMQTVSSAVL
jgi:hypothetical protein